MDRWRFLDTGSLSAAENMALDDVILECRAMNSVPDTLRLLQFRPPAVLVGYHQAVEQEVRTEFCRRGGIDINRRITGGGAIFFDEKSLGWEAIVSKSNPQFNLGVEGLYRKMCEGAILGLKMLGIQASFRPKNDIEVKGRKISGTGGTERDGALLFQGTLLIDFDVETMLRALRIPVMKLKDKEINSVKDRVTFIKRELGYLPNLEKVKGVLKRGFEEALGIELKDGELTGDERSLLKGRLERFQSEDWIFLERRPSSGAAEVYAIDKTPGGLIRVSLAIDRDVIRSVFITGDFFVYPSRAILDLEANLKYAPCEEDEIKGLIRHFFAASKARVLGVTPDVFVDLILEAIGKRKYEALGISLPEANHIYTVNNSDQKILDTNYSVLLLPYCAKLPACEYRRKDGCVKCGGCSVGAAYELAEEAGLSPITIQNSEHLVATLETLRQRGVEGYIGCCCEGFYCKHKDELERIGIPGILIDIDSKTCYDLGKEEDALRGCFESQTNLRIDLLRRLVDQFAVKQKISGRGLERECQISM